MKFLQLTIKIAVFLLLPFNFLQSQWTDKGDYKELRVADSVITQLVVPPGDSLFYVLTKDFQYKKFDYLGNLTSEKSVPAKIGNVDLTSINADGRFLFYDINMFDTETGDSSSSSWMSCGTGQRGYSYTNNLYYDTYSNNLILTFSCVYDMGSGSSGYEDSKRDGAVFLKKNLQDTNIIINYGSPEIAETDIFSKKFLFVGVWSFTRGRPGDYYYFDDCSTNVCFYKPDNYGLQKSIYYENYWDFEGKKLRYRLKNADEGFIEINQKNIKVTDIINGKMVDVDNFDLDFIPLFIIFSANDRFLIAVDKYYGISIIDIKSKYVVRKYPAISSYPITDLKLTLQGKGFFVVTKDGMVRLYSLPYLTDIEEQTETHELSLFPNPATDFLEISVGAQHAEPLKNIEIFSVLGEKVLTTPALRATPPESGGDKVKIDVSSFPTGLYFLKVGDRVGKFIKI